uniref:RING-type domain-containing protein n=1 Tax=Macrostomum lignano TaxID=282301 RepID=A0A1I8H8G8_9PLAT
MNQNICKQVFSGLYHCPTCSRFIEKARICKCCHHMSCKNCKQNPEWTENVELNCHWCSFEALDCCWMPGFSAKFKHLSGRRSLLSAELYSELAEYFECKICSNLLRKTHLCSSCSQPLCRRCFAKAIRRNPVCPLCRAPQPDMEDTVPCSWIDQNVAKLREINSQAPYIEAETESEFESDDETHQLSIFKALFSDDSLHDHEATNRVLFNCLKKQQTTSRIERPCFLLLAHTDNAKQRASADGLAEEISKLLAKCHSALPLTTSVRNHCSDHSDLEASSESSCVLFRNLQGLSMKEFKMHSRLHRARLILITMALPGGYALTEGAALYRLRALQNSELDKVDAERLGRLVQGNVLSV